MGVGRTPAQTIGPFFHNALLDRDRSELISSDHPSAIEIRGAVYDGAGEVVTDAMVEIWQADPAGRYDDPKDSRDDPPLQEGFTGFGRSGTVGGGSPSSRSSQARFQVPTVDPRPRTSWSASSPAAC